jgi:hypothetical protein
MVAARCVLGILLILSSLSACSPFPTRVGVPTPGGKTPAQANAAETRRPTLPARKVVAAKQDERTVLIAQDGTWCSVSSSRYERIRVGDAVLCAWQT